MISKSYGLHGRFGPILLLTALSGASAVPAVAAEAGRVGPKVRWAEGDPDACRFGVFGESATQPTTSLLELSPGTYRIAVTCGDDPELRAPPVAVTVKSGRTARPKFDVAKAKIRIMTRRSGAMLAGEARFFEVGRALEDEPVSAYPTNATAKLSTGRYDVRVRVTASGEPAAEALITRVKLKPGRNKDIVVDLSDGSLVAKATENRRRTDGSVRVFEPGTDKRVALGDTDQELRLPAGLYDVTIGLRSAANFASDTQPVWIRAGKTTKVKAGFKTGKLAVRVTQDGKPIEATVRLSLPLAADFFNFFEAPGPAVLTPGKYNVTVVSDLAKPLGELRKTNIVVRAKRTSKVSFDVSQATVHAAVTENGRPAAAIVEVREPGGGRVVARMGKVGVRLWPGRYELLAKLPDGSEKVDGPFELALGQKVRRKIAFERARLEVLALRGPAPETAAKVLVFRPGAAKPVVEGKHGEVMTLPGGTYDLKVIAGADTVWKQGVAVEGKARVQVALPELADEEALPEGEAPADDFALPEGDADP